MANKKKQKKKSPPAKQPAVARPKEFLDLIAPAAVKFNTDHFILGGTYRSVVAIRSYPPTTEELALLRRLGELEGVTLRLFTRRVTTAEEDAIIHAATNKNRMERSNFSNMKQSITAEEKIQDVETLIKTTRRQTEPLIHCSCFLELTANTMEDLRTLRDEVNAILIRSKLGTDPLLLRQREGFLSSNPAGQNAFGSFAERVLPATSVANLYPISYSGKTDPMGFYVGRDKYGSNVIVDLDRRADDKTNASALILGNSGQGKTYLLRLLICNGLETGKTVISLDSEHEMEDLCRNIGGCFLDFMDGRHRINLLEPRRWDDGSEPDDPEAPAAFRGTLLAQHVSFLRDIFRVYKDFDTPHIDTLELMIERLYRKWGINDKTDFSRMLPTDYPILSDLYDIIEDAYQNYEREGELKLYPAEMLRDLLLGLHSMCKGADARFFNGHTNISSARFLVFCVKGLDSVAQNLRDTLWRRTCGIPCCLPCSPICLTNCSLPEIPWPPSTSCTCGSPIQSPLPTSATASNGFVKRSPP